MLFVRLLATSMGSIINLISDNRGLFFNTGRIWLLLTYYDACKRRGDKVAMYAQELNFNPALINVVQ